MRSIWSRLEKTLCGIGDWMKHPQPFGMFMFLLMLFLSINQICQAQVPVDAAGKRPKLALVLSGGGARGAAHVGVLKVLEANKIPIDFIVGTSMGSVVGGLYAAGYSPDEMEQLFNKLDWSDLLSGDITEDLLSFRDKTDLQKLLPLEIGIKKGKIALPRGVISVQKLDFLLQKLTVHTSGLQSFDQLRIPFRSVATDAATGKMFLFDKGNLAQAIRASMSIPGVFPPVNYDGKLLMDGFLVANLPVEIAKKWGADIIIAVDVGTTLMKPEDLDNMVNMTAQMLNILTQKNVDESIKLLSEKDTLIRPDLESITTASFAKAPEAIKRGEKAALEHVQEIKRYSVPDEEFQEFLTHQRARDRSPIKIDFVQINQLKRVNEEMVIDRIKTRSGEPLDLGQLQHDITNVYATGDFETVGFNIQEKDGKKGLIITSKEKYWGPEYLRFGLNVKSVVGGSSSFTTIFDYRHTLINSRAAEWKVVGKLGQDTGVFTDFYQPLDVHNRFFFNPLLQYENNLQDIYDGDGNHIAQYRRKESSAGLDFGMNWGSYLEARAGLRRSVLNANPEIGGTTLQSFDDIQKGGILAQITFDRLNDHCFPTKGSKIQAHLYISERKLGAELPYQKFDFNLVKATTFKDRHTLIATLQGGVSLKADTPFYDEFTTGGFLQLSGLADGQLRGNNVAVGSLIYLYKSVDTEGFASRVYLGTSIEAGNVWGNRSDFGQDLILSGSGFVGLDTILGPLYVGYGLAKSSTGRAFTYLGRTF